MNHIDSLREGSVITMNVVAHKLNEIIAVVNQLSVDVENLVANSWDGYANGSDDVDAGAYVMPTYLMGEEINKAFTGGSIEDFNKHFSPEKDNTQIPGQMTLDEFYE